MIRKLKVVGLNETIDRELTFNSDLNILTGVNGSGKTTLLKVIWLIVSGNIDRLLLQIDFRLVRLETDAYAIEILKDHETGEVKIDSDISIGELFTTITGDMNTILRTKRVELLIKEMLSKIPSSIFFPTFRRIEGGFINSGVGYDIAPAPRSSRAYRRGYDENEDLEESLSRYSNVLSNENHKFVSSLSTNDIKEMLSTKFAEISSLINSEYQAFSARIINMVMKYERESETSTDAARETLEKLRTEAEVINRRRDGLQRPFTVLSEQIQNIFVDKGIRITDFLSLGNSAKKIIDSSWLSSGEKQMLSFLCYNTFISNSPLFIDEPELSLHVDWQRSLIRILMNQGSNNQLFIATHSQLIYSNFSDKEIELL